jgi:hypothetical protein
MTEEVLRANVSAITIILNNYNYSRRLRCPDGQEVKIFEPHSIDNFSSAKDGLSAGLGVHGLNTVSRRGLSAVSIANSRTT